MNLGSGIDSKLDFISERESKACTFINLTHLGRRRYFWVKLTHLGRMKVKKKKILAKKNFFISSVLFVRSIKEINKYIRMFNFFSKSTSNYVARKFGVRAAMPGFIARELCPQLVIVECNFEKYRLESQRVM
jgi:hypothetical protein